MPYTCLKIRSYCLDISLGCLAEEKKNAQPVTIDVAIEFNEPPTACTTDQIDGAICYDELCQKLKEVALSKHFHLIEHLGARLHLELKKWLSHDMKIFVRVVKMQSPVEGLKGGAQFEWGDSPPREGLW